MTLLGLTCGALVAPAQAAVAPLRVAVVSPAPPTGAETQSFVVSLQRTLGDAATVSTAAESAAAGRLSVLRTADVAVFLGGPGRAGGDETSLVSEFLHSGKGIVVLGARAEAWPAELRFETEVLGGTRREFFAKGAPLGIINPFPHAIFTGVDNFVTDQPLPFFDALPPDVEIIMEGTVGEATAPVAWLRRGGRRLFHLVVDDPVSRADPACARLVANAVLWAGRRPIPGAQAAVQRTFMADAYPGAFAITMPNGPGVCLDPVRGGINYLWDGDFVDLRPRWITKQGEPARTVGEVFYREKEWQPLRAGAGGAPMEFRGYTLHAGYPEFHYVVGGRTVSERLVPAADGVGIVRHFKVGPGAAPLSMVLEPQTGATVTPTGLERDGNLATFASPAAGEFSIEIRRQAVRAP